MNTLDVKMPTLLAGTGPSAIAVAQALGLSTTRLLSFQICFGDPVAKIEATYAVDEANFGEALRPLFDALK